MTIRSMRTFIATIETVVKHCESRDLRVRIDLNPFVLIYNAFHDDSDRTAKSRV